jgi:hypothetical protein
MRRAIRQDEGGRFARLYYELANRRHVVSFDLHRGAQHHQVATGNRNDAIQPFIKADDPRC